MKKAMSLLALTCALCVFMTSCAGTGSLLKPSAPSSGQSSSSSAPVLSSSISSDGSAPPSSEGDATSWGESSSEASSAASSEGSSSTTSSGGGEYASKPLADNDKWYYVNLTDTQKAIYSRIKVWVSEHSYGYLSLADIACNIDDITVADYAVRADNPDIFWIPDTYLLKRSGNSFSLAYAINGNDGALKYTCTAAESAELRAALQREITAFKGLLSKDMTEYEVELVAHDLIAERVVYSTAAAEDHASHPLAFTAYGALVEGSAVCEGYAKALQLLLNSVGISCITVTGRLSSEGHMWNMVRIGGDWYNTDVTSDDGELLYHRFFNQTDAYMLGATYEYDEDYSHELLEGASFNLKRPTAAATVKSYYSVSGYTIKTLSPDKTFMLVVDRAKKAGKAQLELYLDPSVDILAFQGFSKYVGAALTELSSLGISSLQTVEFAAAPRNAVLKWK